MQIIEKPEWISWEDIRQVLLEAHSINRDKGIFMSHYQWPADKIRDSVSKNGTFLVALDGEKLVGTAAICEREGDYWYTKGRYAFFCYASVLQGYTGRGIYKELTREREAIALSKGYRVFVLDTHEKNMRLQNIASQNGYRLVRYFRVSNKDHFNVIMAKWPDGCPYSRLYCRIRFLWSKIKVKIHCCFSI